MAKFAVKILGYIEAKDDAEAAAVAKKLDDALRSPMAKLYFAGKDVKFAGANVDLKPTKVG